MESEALKTAGIIIALALSLLDLYLRLRKSGNEVRESTAKADNQEAGVGATHAETAASYAEAAAKISDAYESALGIEREQRDRLLKDMGERVDAVEQQARMANEESAKANAEIHKLRLYLERSVRRIAYLMEGIGKLLDQLTKREITPCWTPDDWSLTDDKGEG